MRVDVNAPAGADDLGQALSLPLSPEVKVVCEYIYELTKIGPFLPYEDYELIGLWLRSAHLDRVLLALEEIYAAHHRQHGYYPRQLRYVHPKVMQVLQAG